MPQDTPFSNRLLSLAGINSYEQQKDNKTAPPPFLQTDIDKKLNQNVQKPKTAEELVAERGIKWLQRSMDRADKNAQMTPYTYNAGADSHAFYKRYAAFGQEKMDKIGFSPFKDNDAAFNAQTSFLDKTQRSLVHGFAPLFARGFVSGPKSLGRMLQGDFGDDPEDARKYAEAAAIAHDSSGGIGAFFNNSLMNFGYSAGIMAEAVVEELALTAVGGIGGAANLPRFGSQVSRAMSGIKGISSIADMTTSLGKSLKSLTNIDKAREFFSATRIEAGLETRLGKAIKFFNPAENLLETGLDIAKNAKQLQGWNRFNNAAFKTAGALYRDVRNINMALAEARLEGGFQRNEVFDKLVNDYRSKHNGQLPPDHLKNAMMAEAESASKDALFANSLLIFASNKVTFGNIMNPKSGLSRMLSKKVAEVQKMAGQSTVREFTKKTLKSGKELLTPKLSTVKGTWQAFKKQGIQKGVKGVIGYTKANLMEGVQEVLQDVISETSKNYHLQSFYSQPVGQYMYTEAERKLMKDKSFSELLGEAFKKQASMQGFETFASGFVMGAFASPLNRAIPFAQEKYMQIFKKDEYKANRDIVDNYVNRMTNSVNETIAKNPLEFLNSKVFTLGTQAELANVIDSGDTKAERDAKEEATIKNVTDLIKMDSLEIWTDYMESLKDLTTEEYAEAVGISVEQAEGHVEKLDKVINRAKEIEQTYKDYNKKFPNPIDLNEYEKGTTAYEKASVYHAAWEEGKKNLIFYHENYKDTVTRMQSIYQAIGQEELLGKIDPNRVQALLKDDRMLGEIQILESEVQGLKGMTDPVSKRKLKETENTLGILKEYQEDYENFMSHFYEAGMTEQGTEEEQYKKLELDNEVVNKLESSFKKYMRSLAKQSDDLILNDSIDNAFEKLVDYYKLGKEANKLSDAVNVMNDPEGFIEHVGKTYDWMYEMWNNREEYIRENINKQLDIIKSNQLLNDMAAIGVYVDLDEFAEFNETGAIPTEFFDDVNKRVIKKGSPIYDKVANRFRELSQMKKILKESKPITKNKNEELAKLDAEEAEVISKLPKVPTKVVVRKLEDKKDFDIKFINDELSEGQGIDVTYKEEGVEKTATFFKDQDGILRQDNAQGEVVDLESKIKYNNGEIFEIIDRPTDADIAEVRKRYDALRAELLERLTKYGPSASTEAMAKAVEEVKAMLLSDDEYTATRRNYIIKGKAYERMTNRIRENYSTYKYKKKGIIEDAYDGTIGVNGLTEDSIKDFIKKLKSEEPPGFEDYTYTELEEELKSLMDEPIATQSTAQQEQEGSNAVQTVLNNAIDKIKNKVTGFNYQTNSLAQGEFVTLNKDLNFGPFKKDDKNIVSKDLIDYLDRKNTGYVFGKANDGSYLLEIRANLGIGLATDRPGNTFRIYMNINANEKEVKDFAEKVLSVLKPIKPIENFTPEEKIRIRKDLLNIIDPFIQFDNYKKKDSLNAYTLQSLKEEFQDYIKKNETLTTQPTADIEAKKSEIETLEKQKQDLLKAQPTQSTTGKTYQDLLNEKWPDTSGYLGTPLGKNKFNKAESNFISGKHFYEIRPLGNDKFEYKFTNNKDSALRAYSNYERYILTVADDVNHYSNGTTIVTIEPGIIRKEGDGFVVDKKVKVFYANSSTIGNKVESATATPAAKVDTTEIDAKITKAKQELADLESSVSTDVKSEIERRRKVYNKQYNDLVAGRVLDNDGEPVYEEDKGIGANGLSTLTDKKYGHGHIRTSGLNSLKVLEDLLEGAEFSGMFGEIGQGAYSTWESGKFIIVSNNINPTKNNKLNLNEIEILLNAGLTPFAQELANKYPNVIIKDFNGKKYDAELDALGQAPAQPASAAKTKEAELEKLNASPEFQTFNIPISKKQDIKNVVAGPLLNASEIFWDKNIRTTGSWIEMIQGETAGEDYIEIAYDSLSEENKKIADKLKKSDTNFGRIKGVRIVLGNNLSAQDAQRKSIEIANKFKQQDLLWYTPQTLQNTVNNLEADKKRYPKSVKEIDQEIERVKDTWGQELNPGEYFDKATKTIWASEELYKKSKGLSISANIKNEIPRSVQKQLDALNDKIDKLNEQIDEADDAGNKVRGENLRMRRQELYDLLKQTADKGKESVPEIKSDLKNYIINYAIENTYETAKANGIYLDEQFKAVFDPKSEGPKFDPKYISQEAYDNLFGENGYITSIKKRADAGEFYVFSTDLIVYTDKAKDAQGNPLPPVAGEIDFIFVDREGRKFIVDLKTGQVEKWLNYNTVNTKSYEKKIDNTLQQVGYANLSQLISGDEFQIAIWPVELNYKSTGFINRAGRPSNTTLMLNQKPIGDLNSEPFIINLDKNTKFKLLNPEGDGTEVYMTVMDYMEQYVTGPVTPGTKKKAKPKAQSIPQDESSIVNSIVDEIETGNVIKAGMDANIAKTQGQISDASYKYLIGLINDKMNTNLMESAVLAAPGQEFITINDIFAEKFDGVVSVETKVNAGEIVTVESVDEANEEIILTSNNGDRFTVKFSEMNDYIVSPEQLEDLSKPSAPTYQPTQTEIDFTSESISNVDEFLDSSELRNEATNEADNQTSDDIDNDLFSNLKC